MKAIPRITLFVLVGCGLAGLLGSVGCSKQDQRSTGPVEVRSMIEQLGSSDEHQRVDACIALGSAGPQAAEAVPALTVALKDPSSLVSSMAAYALGQIGPAAVPALPELHNLLSSGDPEVSRSAISAMRLIEAPSAQ